jgi:5'-phosphate synthase pdxT subunit
LRIGVLALQGAFVEHEKMLGQLGVEAPEIRLPSQLSQIDGLIIPGGESTTMGKLAVTYGLLEPIRQKAAAGWPIWGTCAGMVVLARDIGELSQPLIGLMDITVERNAFGRQVDSFVTDLNIPELGEGGPFPAVFIRAPRIQRAGPGVQVLAKLEDGAIVAARQGNLLVTAFHPELTRDPRFHRYFARLVEESGYREKQRT